MIDSIGFFLSFVALCVVVGTIDYRLDKLEKKFEIHKCNEIEEQEYR